MEKSIRYQFFFQSMYLSTLFVISKTFRNRIQEVPFFMVVDDEKKSIIISIRGTISIADMFTGMTSFSPYVLLVPGYEDEGGRMGEL